MARAMPSLIQLEKKSLLFGLIVDTLSAAAAARRVSMEKIFLNFKVRKSFFLCTV